MLYYPDRHESLSRTAWDEGAARAAIAAIAAEAHDHYDSEQFWPSHPREDGRGVLKGLWFGAAGAIWALGYLSECGAVSSRFDCADAIARLHLKFLAEDPHEYSGSLLMGENGPTGGAASAGAQVPLMCFAVRQAPE